MRARKIFETLGFEQGGDPYKKMGIGKNWVKESINFEQGGNSYSTLRIGYSSIIKELLDATEIHGNNILRKFSGFKQFRNTFINSKNSLIYFKNILNTSKHNVYIYYVWDKHNGWIYEHRSDIETEYKPTSDVETQYKPVGRFGFAKYYMPNIEPINFYKSKLLIVDYEHWTQDEYDRLYPYLNEMITKNLRQ